MVSERLGTLIIGHNKGWKQNVQIGRVNNQNFVAIPHSTFIHMLTYKAQLAGIKVIVQEEDNMHSLVRQASLAFLAE
jgi:putative transposase